MRKYFGLCSAWTDEHRVCSNFPLFGSSYYPLDRIPDELLVLILEHVGAIRQAPPPVATLRVCKRLRAIALTTPRLWPCIVLYGRRPIRGLDKLILLSGSEPLYLDLDVAGEASYPDTQCTTDQVHHVAATVASELHRVVRLQLRYHPADKDLFSASLSLDAPILEELVLMCGGVANLRALNAPRLHRLEIDRMQLASFAVPVLQTLQTLILEGVQLSQLDVYDIIASAHNLEHLEVTDAVFGVATPAAPLARLAALKHLVIIHPYSQLSSPLLEQLVGIAGVASLDRLELALDTPPGDNELIFSLCTLLRPQSLRVTRDAERVWRAELGDARRALSFPQHVAGPVLSVLLYSVAEYVRRIEADEAFCNQLVRRAQDLPYLQRFEELELVPDEHGRPPSQAAAALEACQLASQQESDQY